MPKWQWILGKFTKKLWFRTGIFLLIGLCTAALSYVLKSYIPDSFARGIGADAVDGILHIIANSMLAVTTFSLSVMVAAYAAASSSATPRATKLLLEDGTTQNALSVFIGSFVFSLVGIVTLNIGLYGESGRLVLLVVTIGIIICVVLVLLKWIQYLSRLGRLDETVKMVETATMEAMTKRLKKPYLGAHRLTQYTKQPKHVPVIDHRVGYIQNIDMKRISSLAETHNITLYIQVLPGHFCDSIKPVAYLSSPVDEEVYKDICSSFTIDKYRSFEQDPRFGFIVMNEIASRALSSSVNDPGTAICIIGRMLHLMLFWVTQEGEGHEPEYPRVYIPEISLEKLFDDNFSSIARDSAKMLEVAIYLQKAFHSLNELGHESCSRLAQLHSHLAFKRAKEAMTLDEDLARLEKYVIQLKSLS